MRALILSDIHANLTALEAVLSDAGEVDEVWCLGDIVGYGPDPNQCVERIRELNALTCVIGNHDAAALGRIDINAFNADAKLSLQWHAEKLKPENRQFLESLSNDAQWNDSVTMVHGSPRSPVWEYVIEMKIAKANLTAFATPICLVGHTHIPLVFSADNGSDGITAEYLQYGVRFFPSRKCIINPGSVGQPRDRDPRAAFLIYDSEENVFEEHRVDYDIRSVQERIYKAGLPTSHALRLSNGA